MYDYATDEQNNRLIDRLTVLHGITENKLVLHFLLWREAPNNRERYTLFLRLLFEENAQDDFLGYLGKQIVENENAFSRTCASGDPVSPYLRRALIGDLTLIKSALPEKDKAFELGQLPPLLGGLGEMAAAWLEMYYRQNGFGAFLQYTAFRYAETTLIPIRSPSTTALTDLKDYANEKAVIKDNLENFLSGLPYSDMLLYGDRGTGKSSTIHAMLNAFSSRKLRLVEIAKEDILSLPKLKTELSEIPMKFIVFIDDFSLSEDDERFSTLKASLQGSMEGHTENVMIVATSNRRHIVEENFDTRQNSVHINDSRQELLSLSDRFGITVLFSATNKEEYLSIVRQLADDAKLKTQPSLLESNAELWALRKGGRSPRRAKQFIDYMIACEARNVPPKI